MELWLDILCQILCQGVERSQEVFVYWVKTAFYLILRKLRACALLMGVSLGNTWRESMVYIQGKAMWSFQEILSYL